MSDQVLALDSINMAAGAADLAKEADGLRDTLDHLKSRVMPVIEQWVGETSNEFRVSRQKWNDSANHLQEVLKVIGKSVAEMGEDGADTERRNTARFSA